MAIKNKKEGFALLIAVIFMSVMLALGLALSSLGYKQEVLSSSAIESQYAFYAADAGLECALYADQGQNQNIFAYANYNPNSNPSMDCDGTSFPSSTILYNNSVWESTIRLSLDNNTHCADVTVYKYSTPQPPPNNITTYLFSQGYDVSCATVAIPNGARFVSRGIDISY